MPTGRLETSGRGARPLLQRRRRTECRGGASWERPLRSGQAAGLTTAVLRGLKGGARAEGCRCGFSPPPHAPRRPLPRSCPRRRVCFTLLARLRPSADPATTRPALLSPAQALMAAARTDSGEVGIAEDEAAGQNVCCNLCVRKQNRFVVLGCSHTFCWPCISSTALRLPPSQTEIPLLRSRMRSQSRDSLRGISPHGSLSHSTAMELGTPVGSTLAATTNGSAWWPGDPDASDTGTGPEDPRSFVKCAVCDSLEDLSMGHMELNPLLGDFSYVWIAAPLPKNGRNHGTVRADRAPFALCSLESRVPAEGSR